MLIILPFVAGNLPDVERKLNGTVIRDLLENNLQGGGMGPEIFLPRFKIEFSIGLGDTLKAMGAASLFDSHTANLTGMIENDNVAVSQVIHKGR